MALTQAEVKHVTRLARMQLPPNEMEQMRVQVSAILDHIQKLQEVNVDGVFPTSQITGITSLMRPDEVTTSLTQEQVLANAPDHSEGMFRVKAIFED
jgi:aspartyl-tRNA(Asn)/glutamyl-tRNA(Gln) amidotransferase subunit C